MPAVYKQLKALAAGVRGGFFEVDTMNTTALVHEAYLRMDRQAVSREHFLRLSARIMRNILVDYVRARKAEKRTPVKDHGGPDDYHAASQEFLVALDAGLEKLEKINPRLVQVVECHYFGGFSLVETADALGVNERTVRRDWTKAKALLQRMMEWD